MTKKKVLSFLIGPPKVPQKSFCVNTVVLSEPFKLEYRVEAFNVFNDSQFTGVPPRNVTTLTGQFRDFNLLNGGGRTMRMGLKLIF